jgi:UDP-glucose 4-epimerase
MNLILTGHKGLIGSYLKKKLEKEGHRTIQGIDLREGKNILNIDNLKIKDKIDLMIHASAHCKINQSIKNPELAYKNNVEGTFKILEFCRKNKIPKIVFFSSSRTLSKEKNPYTASKIYGEELCKAYQNSYGIDYIIIRPSTVYGPFWDKTQRLMHIFITNSLEGKDLEIYGNLETKTLDFTYINDFIKGTMLAINHPRWNKEYNISGKEEANIYDLAKFIIQETKSQSQIKVFDSEIAQPQQVKVNISEIEKIGYSPQVDLKEGVRKTISWYEKYLQTD